MKRPAFRFATVAVLSLLAMSFYARAILVAPESPSVRAFGDNQDWILLEEMIYSFGNTKKKVLVPAGFVTDFASIPPALAAIGLSAQGQYSRAAIVHDYLYWTQVCTRDQADRILVIAMKESDVGVVDEATIYQGVHVFGQSAWDANGRERSQSLPRVVPERLRRPTDPNETWPSYRKVLVERGIKDPAFEKNPTYCSYGDSFKIPRI